MGVKHHLSQFEKVPRGKPLRGLTLIELLVAMSILALISILVFSAMDGMRRSRQGIERITDRYREGRMAMARMTRELQGAYLTGHAPIDSSLLVVQSIFAGEPDSSVATLTFNSFSGRRYRADQLATDQLEITYFGSEDPDERGVIDLARRSALPDEEPEEGGRVEVLATNIDLFEIEYLDPITGRWLEEWDSSSIVEEGGRLPRQVKLTLVLNDGRRNRSDSGRGKIRLVTIVDIPMDRILNFAMK